MIIWYVLKLRKAIDLIKLISTTLFVALNKEGVKNVIQLHYSQYRIDTASVYKVFCFPVRSNQPF